MNNVTKLSLAVVLVAVGAFLGIYHTNSNIESIYSKVESLQNKVDILQDRVELIEGVENIDLADSKPDWKKMFISETTHQDMVIVVAHGFGWGIPLKVIRVEKPKANDIITDPKHPKGKGF